jgi:nitroreductase
MNFYEIAQNRQSCRAYDASRLVEEEKINAILESARIAPSACNGQPYHFTVCRGEAAQKVAKATQGMGMNKFASDAPNLRQVLSELDGKISTEQMARLTYEVDVNGKSVDEVAEGFLKDQGLL